MMNLTGSNAIDSRGNRYKITAHYGGAGLPVPEMVCMTLISRPAFSVMPTQRFVSVPRNEFNEEFTVVKPLEKA
jgi:hypothetical protein